MKTRRPVRGFGALADAPSGHGLKAKDDGTRRSGPSRTRFPRPRLRVSQKVPVVEGPGKPPCAGRGGWRRSQRFPGGGLRLGRGGPRWPRAAGGRVPRPAPSPCASPSRGKMETGPESGRSSQEMGGELRSQERRGRSERSAPEVQPYPRAVPPNTGLPSCNSASSQKAWVAVDCLRGRLREPHSQRGDKRRSWSIWVLGHIRPSPGPP